MNKQICFLFMIFLFVIIVGSLGMGVSREGLTPTDRSKCAPNYHPNRTKPNSPCEPNTK